MTANMHMQEEGFGIDCFFSSTKWVVFSTRSGCGVLTAMKLFLLRLHCDFVRRFAYLIDLKFET
jgi:hypothetical protein